MHGKADTIEKAEPNPVVCGYIADFFRQRAIADPLIASQIFPNNINQKEKKERLAELKKSHDDLSNRIHPWMTPEIQQTVKGLAMDDAQRRRNTTLFGEGLDS